MASVTLTNFYNPLGNSDADIVGLLPANTTYPLTLDASNSYKYDYPSPTFEYGLFYNTGTNQLEIIDNTGPLTTSVYGYNGATARYECISDVYSRASVLATYFTTNNTAIPSAPQIFIRPKPFPTSITYTVNSNAQFTSSINLVVTGPGGSDYSFVPTSNWFKYNVTGLTIGCNYQAIAYQTDISGVSSISTVFRTVQTGYEPGPVSSLTGNIVGTDVKLNWAFSSSNGSATINWHVIRDFSQNYKYNVPGTISSFNAPLLIPGQNLFSVEAVNDPGYSTRVYWSTITV
jgi:hypothetical protein